MLFTASDKKITIKKFLKTHEYELVDNLYTITITGKLIFEQTLLYSKLISTEKLDRRISELLNGQENDSLTNIYLKKAPKRKKYQPHLILLNFLVKEIIYELSFFFFSSIINFFKTFKLSSELFLSKTFSLFIYLQ